MFKERTDLALEMHEINIENKIDDGIIVEEFDKSGIKISRIEIINANGAEKLNKPIGVYVTVDLGDFWNRERSYISLCIDILFEEINSIIPDNIESYLVAGLGNRKLVCDSIGPEVIDKLIVTHHLKIMNNKIFENFELSDVSAVIPGVMSDTGLESADIIKNILSTSSSDAVLVIDALASRNINRLCSTIQLSNTGISPGSGVKNNRKEIGVNNIGVPVFSIGVPTVVDASTLVYNVLRDNVNIGSLVEDYFKNENNFYVSLKESDILINKLSNIIGKSLNMALHNRINKNVLEDFYE